MNTQFWYMSWVFWYILLIVVVYYYIELQRTYSDAAIKFNKIKHKRKKIKKSDKSINKTNIKPEINIEYKKSDMDPMYKKLEESLRILYDYPEVYIDEHLRSKWYVPYMFPKTQSQNDLFKFIEFGQIVINNYPQSYFCKPKGIGVEKINENESIYHPLLLKIWKHDADDIINRATAINI